MDRESNPVGDLATIHDSRFTVHGATPVALTIAGSDCSAGAGLQADLKTFRAFQVYGLSAVTCVVAEVPGKVSRLDPVDPANVRQQIELCLANFPVKAIKTGLLCSAAILETVADALEKHAPATPLVVDPVMVATSGDILLEPEAIEFYRTRLFPRAALVTPNMAEAAALIRSPVRNLEEMHAAGARLAEEFGSRFLIKGGHLSGERAVDLLVGDGEMREFTAPLVAGVSTHGTGCTYSAAITAGLALGDSLEDAIARAKEFVSRAIRDHFTWGKIDALRL
ncbi:MAG TPA: bifunctional hydroxymethylpyrimidine kinase/phosphomethylpyrimidine kinase [Chthoniobacterales bacterium]|nr:bifunctional hydroxymethylpyrimidine kinase/phosphomethylpyrimidine kinase [Chthoniobacterales bacterium]